MINTAHAALLPAQTLLLDTTTATMQKLPALTTTVIDPSLVKITLPADTTLTATQATPGSTIGTPPVDTSQTSTNTTGTGTTGTSSTGAVGALSGTQQAGTTSATTGSTAGTTSTTGTRNPDGIRTGTNLSGTVDLQTLDLGPLDQTQTQQTQEESQQCLPAEYTGGQCIQPGQAAEYAAPGIINGQTKISIVVLITTLIGLAVTILISYILNNVRSRRDLERIKKDQQTQPKKFAAGQITANYPQIIDSLATIINKTDSGKTHTPQELQTLKKDLNQLELFGTAETSQNATELLNLLSNPAPDKTAQSQLKQTAQNLATSLKTDLRA